MTRTKRILLIFAGAFLIYVCGISWLGYYYFSPNSPKHRAATIETILRWGRLAPFPKSAQSFTMETTGNMFTRGFRASFTAPAPDIELWIQQSPGTNSIVPSIPSPGVRHFQIIPGGGAQGAEVTVDDSNHRVSIYVYWS